MAKVNLVRQEPNESLAAFLERLMEAFRQYTPMDPQADESCMAVMLAFVNQAAPDIRRKLQKIERLGEQSIQDLVRAAKRAFNHRETPEERKEGVRREEREFRAKENCRNQKELAQIFSAGVRQRANSQGTSEVRLRDEGKQVGQRLKRTNVHIVRSKDTGEESALKENQGKSPPGKKHLPWGPTFYMQEMIAIRGIRAQPSSPSPG